jgi:RNA polymerase sigma-70 factor (ECF subfamily)
MKPRWQNSTTGTVDSRTPSSCAFWPARRTRKKCTWLTRIARNRAIDRLRARRARANVNVEPTLHAADDAPRSGEPVTRDTPETVLESRTMAGAVRTALAALTPAQRALIEAAYFEGYTHSELATRFGVPLGTVKTRIRTGLAAMRDRLAEVI